MTILHKCSKTHGHCLVFLVTSWLRRKAEKCDRISWAGLWRLPWLRLAGRLGGAGPWSRPGPGASGCPWRCGWHSCKLRPPLHPRWGWEVSSKVLRRPCARGPTSSLACPGGRCPGIHSCVLLPWGQPTVWDLVPVAGYGPTASPRGPSPSLESTLCGLCEEWPAAGSRLAPWCPRTDGSHDVGREEGTGDPWGPSQAP